MFTAHQLFLGMQFERVSIFWESQAVSPSAHVEFGMFQPSYLHQALCRARLSSTMYSCSLDVFWEETSSLSTSEVCGNFLLSLENTITGVFAEKHKPYKGDTVPKS